MAQLIVSLNPEQLDQLHAVAAGPAGGLTPVPPGAIGADVVSDPTGALDGIIIRSVGTVLALAEHQQRGGTVLLGFADGSLREVEIDVHRDGISLPSPSPAETRRSWSARWRDGRSRAVR